ncbi:hypothetical protein HanIR_Chr06g0257481 [Helianthus annuus]|nr:hypothetical protein HanIR_Chr06g0257481 [Helianthus annuus]
MHVWWINGPKKLCPISCQMLAQSPLEMWDRRGLWKHVPADSTIRFIAFILLDPFYHLKTHKLVWLLS